MNPFPLPFPSTYFDSLSQALKKGAAVSSFNQVLTKLTIQKNILQDAFLVLAKNLPRQLVQNIAFRNKFATSFEQEQWETHLQRIREEQLVLLAENRLLVQKVKNLNNQKCYVSSSTVGAYPNAPIPQQYLFIKWVQYNIHNQLIYSFIKWRFRTLTLRENEKQYYLCSAIALHMWNSCHTTVNKYMAFYHVSRQVKDARTNQRFQQASVFPSHWKTLQKNNNSYTHTKEHLCYTKPHQSNLLPSYVSNANSSFMLKYNVTPLTHSTHYKPWLYETNVSNFCSSDCTKSFSYTNNDQCSPFMAFRENRQQNTNTFHEQ